MFSTEFWQAFSRWGVPGLALAVMVVLLVAIRLTKIPSKSQGRLAALIVLVTGGIVLVSVIYYRPLTENDFVVRVTAVDVQGNPLNDAHIVSSLGGEGKRVEGGTEFLVPASGVPENGLLTLFATVDSKGLSGKRAIRLSNEHVVAVFVELKEETNGEIAGFVMDEHGKGVANVQILFSDGKAVSDSDGRFQLKTGTPNGKEILLHVSHEDYAPTDQYGVAGNDKVSITLRKKT